MPHPLHEPAHAAIQVLVHTVVEEADGDQDGHQDNSDEKPVLHLCREAAVSGEERVPDDDE